jgi:hypothetical protein
VKPRVTVHLWSALRALADGHETITVDASTIGEMLRALEREYPALSAPIKAGVSVAVDGKVYAYGLTQTIGPENEIYLMQRIKGG